MQPAYLPWIGYFQRIALSDLHVILDHVEIDKNSKTKFVNRNKIRTPEGWSWLTVPLKVADVQVGKAINHLEIDNGQPWAKKHQKAIRHSYGRAAYKENLDAAISSVYDKTWNRLTELLSETTAILLAALEMKPDVHKSSSMEVSRVGSDLILEICLLTGASEYISGPFGRNYLDREAFRKAGVKLLFHEYSPEVYPQIYPGFEPYLSILDLLFNCGSESSKLLLQRGAQLNEL